MFNDAGENSADTAAEQAEADELLPPLALAICSQPAAAMGIKKGVHSSTKAMTSGSSALHRYQHYMATLGRELALLLLCQGTSALAAAVRVSYRLAHMLGIRLHRWLSTSPLPKAAAAVLARVLRVLRSCMQQHVVGPLGRLLTQLVWVQVQLSTDDELDEDTRVSARVNSCVSLLFGSIRLRSHSCLQLAVPSRQPVLAPEFSLSSPAPSPTRQPGILRVQQQRLQQQQHQQQQQQRRLLRSASTPTPNSSPRGARATAGAVAASFSSRRRTVIGGSPNSSRTSPWGPMAGPELGPAERASVARALRFSQAPSASVAGLGPDSEVHVLCSSELRSAIMSFLQAHSRRNGSEFVLLRNFATSAPPTPTAAAEAAADTPNTASTPTAATAAAATTAADDTAGALRADVQQHEQQQQNEAVPGFGAAPSGFEAALGFECKSGCGGKASSGTQLRAQIYAMAADGSSGGGWQPPGSSSSSNTQQGACLLERQQQQQQQQQQHAPHGALPLLGNVSTQQQQQEEGGDGPSDGSLLRAEALQQLNQQHRQQQQQETDAAPVRGQDTCSGSNSIMCSSSSNVLANAANLLAAAAEALGDQHGPGSPERSDTSPQKPSAAVRAAAAIAAAAAGASYSSSSGAASGEERGSFVSAADKFRSLAASAAAGSDADLCSKPLMAFSRKQGSLSPPVGMRRSISNRVGGDSGSTGSHLHQQEQYARLFPPGSRSFEALSLRKSGGPSPIGTPACHARNTVTFVKKKLPAAPFSLSASLPLSLDGDVLHDAQ